MNDLYTSRTILLRHLQRQGYDTAVLDQLTPHETTLLYETNQLDFKLTKMVTSAAAAATDTDNTPTLTSSSSITGSNVYVHYTMSRTLRDNDIDDLISKLYYSTFQQQEDGSEALVPPILDKSDTLYIIHSDDPSISVLALLMMKWATFGYFVSVINIKRLLFDITMHEKVPPHFVLSDEEHIAFCKKRQQQEKGYELSKISRFDPVAVVMGVRPEQVVRIVRPSKTAVEEIDYRVCVNEPSDAKIRRRIST